MTRAVTTTVAADNDIRAIATYIAADNVQAARKFEVELKELFARLAEHGEGGKIIDVGLPLFSAGSARFAPVSALPGFLSNH